VGGQTAIRHPVRRIEVRIQVGPHLMAGTDDPLFLGLRGPAGREFRMRPAQGRALRRGSEDHFVFGAAADPDVNVDFPALNDPTQPALDADQIEGVYLRKGLDPIPNVRALGEMDDRLEVAEIEVSVVAEGDAGPRRYARSGPFWLGLVSGLLLEIPRAASGP
jgi:hypothetical protein